MKSGTTDVKTIDRLRRASLQPDMPDVSAAQAQAQEAAQMAAAMAEVEAEERAQEAAEAAAAAQAAAATQAAAAAEAAAAAQLRQAGASIDSLPESVDSLDGSPAPSAPADLEGEGMFAGIYADQPPSEKVKQIEKLYMRHNPEKLDELDTLLERFGEDKLLAMVRQKYNDTGDSQERIAELTYLVTEKQQELRQAVAAGGTHNMARIDGINAEMAALSAEKEKLENPQAATVGASDAPISTEGMSAEEIIRVYQKLDLEAQAAEQAVHQEAAEEMSQINIELSEAKRVLQTYIATNGTHDMAGTIPLTEEVQQLESAREEGQRNANKCVSKIQADLARKKDELKGKTAGPTGGHVGTGGRRASISERMRGTMGIANASEDPAKLAAREMSASRGEQKPMGTMRRLSVSLSGGAQAAQQAAAASAQQAQDEKRREEEAEAQRATALAEQGRKVVVKKQLSSMYRKWAEPERLGGLDALVAQHGVDEIVKRARAEFTAEIKEEQTDLIFDLLGVIGSDVTAEAVAASFESAGYAPETWLRELKEMHANGEVMDFLRAIKHGSITPTPAAVLESTPPPPGDVLGGVLSDGNFAELLPESGDSFDEEDDIMASVDYNAPVPPPVAADEFAVIAEEEEEAEEMGVDQEVEPTTPSSKVTAFSSSEGFVPDTRYDCKLAGKNVQVVAGGMGLQVFPKKGQPTTHIYQTLLGWTQMDDGTVPGFEVDTSDSKKLTFLCDHATSGAIIKAMSKHAMKLAKSVQKQGAQPTPKPIKMDSIQSEETHAGPVSSPEGELEDDDEVTLGESKFDCKLAGKSVQVSAGGMGVQVFGRKGPPTTYIYQTLLGWMATDSGFELSTADGKTLAFECVTDPDQGVDVMNEITSAARSLAKAQQKADLAAGVDLSDEKVAAERTAKALTLAKAAALEPAPGQVAPLTLEAAPGMETKYDCKLGGRSVQVAAGGMGLQVFNKKGGAPTTYLYQTLLAWQQMDKGVEIETSGGKRLVFACGVEEAAALTAEITRNAKALATAQRKADKAEAKAKKAKKVEAAAAAAAAIPPARDSTDAEDEDGAEALLDAALGEDDDGEQEEEPEPVPPPQRKAAAAASGPSKPKAAEPKRSAAAPPPAELYAPDAASDTGSWKRMLSRGDSAMAAAYWAGEAPVDRALTSPLIEELVYALPPLGGTRNAPRPRVADLCVGGGLAASAVLRAYPDVSVTLAACDEDALFRAERQLQQQAAAHRATQPAAVSTALMQTEGSYEEPIGEGRFDVIIAAQSLRELVSPQSDGFADADTSAALDGYRWLFAKVASSLNPGGTFLVADQTDTLGLYGHMRLMEEAGFGEIDCAWRQGNSFVCGGTKAVVPAGPGMGVVMEQRDGSVHPSRAKITAVVASRPISDDM